MRRILTLVASFALVAVMASAAQAELIDDFWQKVTDPNGVNGANAAEVGEEIRVVFATSAKIVGTIQSQDIYNSFAQKAANQGLLTQELDVDGGWRALVTADSAASDSPSPVNEWLNMYGDIKVFNTNGEYVGTAGSMLGGLSNTIQYNEAGMDLLDDGNASPLVWTGTNANGEAAYGPFTSGASGSGPLHLGNGVVQGGIGPFAMAGDMSSTSSDWLADEPFPLSVANGAYSFPLSIYAMSGSIAAVPEPGTLLLWLGFSSMAGLAYWRKRRNG